MFPVMYIWGLKIRVFSRVSAVFMSLFCLPILVTLVFSSWNCYQLSALLIILVAFFLKLIFTAKDIPINEIKYCRLWSEGSPS